MAESYSIVYTYHIFFTHPSVDGYLGFFHILALVNSACMNIEVHVSFQLEFQLRILVFSGYMPRSWIAGPNGSCFSFFKEPPSCSPQWLH